MVQQKGFQRALVYVRARSEPEYTDEHIFTVEEYLEPPSSTCPSSTPHHLPRRASLPPAQHDGTFLSMTAEALHDEQCAEAPGAGRDEHVPNATYRQDRVLVGRFRSAPVPVEKQQEVVERRHLMQSHYDRVGHESRLTRS